MQYSIKDGGMVAKGTWPQTNQAALLETVKKYKYLVAWHKRNPKAPAVNVRSYSCALCQLYLEKDGNCKRCPVMKYTGRPQCQATPWYDYIVENDPLLARAYAQAEVTFLEGLK